MGSSVYVASVEGYTGKSTVALGVLEQLSRRVERVAVFRPIVRPDTALHGGRDYVLDLLTSHDVSSRSSVVRSRNMPAASQFGTSVEGTLTVWA